MEEALRAHLLADPAITGLVGQRVHWGRRPQAGALPSIILFRMGGDRHYATDGPSDLVASRVQVDCWGTSYGSAKNVARAVRDRLSGMREVVNGVAFRGSFIDAERDFSEGPAGADVNIYRTSLDFILWTDDA